MLGVGGVGLFCGMGHLQTRGNKGKSREIKGKQGKQGESRGNQGKTRGNQEESRGVKGINVNRGKTR